MLEGLACGVGEDRREANEERSDLRTIHRSGGGEDQTSGKDRCVQLATDLDCLAEAFSFDSMFRRGNGLYEVLDVFHDRGQSFLLRLSGPLEASRS